MNPLQGAGMADANPKVMDMIRAELKKNPDVSNADLFEKAKTIDKSVGKLSPRQFNAKYPLQVKRGMKPRKRKSGTRKTAAKTRSRPAAGNSRDNVRAVLLDLAKDVANAQGKGDVVDVIAGIDR
ncbi:MAG: hypothetical protein GWN02_30035, partial [Gemmatimonadetes bacterium]|nr:hypothetical protein [Gemmatimonadota bacterium]